MYINRLSISTNVTFSAFMSIFKSLFGLSTMKVNFKIETIDVVNLLIDLCVMPTIQTMNIQCKLVKDK